MDSRLIAGAYSQHYRAFEDQNNLMSSEKLDSIARAKKLSLETNKRRRSQAQKRKIEALREEKRRHEILSKRREEQKQATEKYQRSHIPPSARQHSGRRSPRRPGGGHNLEDALRLIRGSPRHPRPGSARDKVMSPRKENEDPFEKSYFEKSGNHVTRPGSGRTIHQIDQHAHAELMDYSLQNFTSSKTLFEQQLEQQQSLLLKQQQQSLRDFDSAVQQEIESDLPGYYVAADDKKKISNSDDSCSSVDSLEESRESGSHRSDYCINDIQNYNIPADRPAGKYREIIENYQDSRQDQNTRFYLHPSSNDNNVSHTPLNLDITPSAVYQGASNLLDHEGALANISKSHTQKVSDTCKPGRQLEEQVKKEMAMHAGNCQTNIRNQFSSAPLKQFSTDSLESVSSVSTVSFVKAPDEIPSISSAESNSAPSHMAWVSLTSNSESILSGSTPKYTSNDSGLEAYNPRYASAIRLSIWPGSAGNATAFSAPQTTHTSNISTTIAPSNSHSYGAQPNSTPVTAFSVSGLGPRNASILNSFSSEKKNDAVLKSGVIGNGLTSTNQAPQLKACKTNNNESSGMDTNWQDLQYPLTKNFNKSGPQTAQIFVQQQQSPTNTTVTVSAHNQIYQLPPQVPQLYTMEPQNKKVQHYQQVVKQQQQCHSNLSDQQTIHQVQAEQQQTACQISEYQQANTNPITVLPYSGLPRTASGQCVPVPAVRTIFPHQRPPVPKTDMLEATAAKSTATTKDALPREPESDQLVPDNEPHEDKASIVPYEIPRVKSILKAGPSPQQAATKIGGHPRDSLELMRLQGEKKANKKSVRFAEDTKEALCEVKEPVGTGNMVITNSASAIQRPAITRPFSAKVISSTQKTETAVGRGVRAASAGTARQITPQTSYTRNILFSGGSIQAFDQQNPTSSSDIQNLRTNFPTSMHHSVVNRPKAAAHIIMSNSEHNMGEKPGVVAASANPSSAVQGASVAHKSILESKVKNNNNPNFMGSRMPVKIPASSTTVSVYHVAKEEEENLNHPYQVHHHHQSNTLDNNGNNGTQGLDGLYQEQRQRLREPSPASKRVPISNSVVTRTSIVPASTKISVPQTNMGTPSYSTSVAGSNGQGNSGTSGAVYDENGMRIDRTPTDEEITWLWDKVRDCLSKEDSVNAVNDIPHSNKISNNGGSGIDPGKQPPTLSTKLIDGASLGFGLNPSSGANGLRVGTGFFQPNNSPATQNNKVRPALQQQGSYLRRYGLLKQRRVASATGTGSTPVQPPVQRASSAIHAHQLYQASASSLTNQRMDQDGPQPLALTYQPQDGVSDSTAAFIMAERLAKQSLSDSHIQSGMQDAQLKQELHNTRSGRLAVNKGHSALSIEEQNLLASLDKLNERLRATDTHYTGTIQYHQPYQAHLSGFRGATENRRNHGLLSPRSLSQAQQRAQSARIRQQTRQYR